jgi:hypothetical protein
MVASSIVGAAISASGIGSMVGCVAVRLRMRAVIASAAEALRVRGRSGVPSMVCDDFRAWMRSASVAVGGRMNGQQDVLDHLHSIGVLQAMIP